MRLPDLFKRVAKRVCLVLPLRLLVLLSVFSVVKAEVIVSSLSSTNYLTSVSFSPLAWAASSFQTDTNLWNFNTVSIALYDGAITARAFLYSDASGRPAIPLTDCGIRQVTNTTGLVAFAPVTPVKLNPATVYWVVVGNVSTNAGMTVPLANSFVQSSLDFVGVPGSIMTLSITGSGSGSGDLPPSSWGDPSTFFALLFKVEGTPIAAPVLRNCKYENGQVSFEVGSASGMTVVAQSATDQTNWVSFSTNVCSGDFMSFTNSDVTPLGKKFFRAYYQY